MKKYIPRFALCSFILLVLSCIVYFIATMSVVFADFINSTVSVAIRFLLSITTYILPFSFFELVIILLPLILFLTVFLTVRRCNTRVERVRAVISLLSVVSLIFTSYIYTLGVGYRTTALAEKIGIEDKKNVTADELFYTVNIVVDELNLLAEKMELIQDLLLIL